MQAYRLCAGMDFRLPEPGSLWLCLPGARPWSRRTRRRTVALRKPPKRKSMRPETVASKQRNERKKTITMRVLMFGWEFPPHIAGGLGTASYGLTRGLAKHGIEVIFVVPKAYGVRAYL